MSYTPSELVAELDRRGVRVKERRLKDWRKKGLLPPLKRIGLGQHRGTREVWENDDVLQQAIAAEDFLSMKRRANFARSRLWLAGFDVPTESGKEAWLGEVASRKRFLEKPTVNNVSRLEVNIRSLNNSYVKEFSEYEFHGRDLVIGFIYEIVDLINHPTPEFDPWVPIDIVSDLDGPPITEAERKEGESFLSLFAHILQSSSIYNLPRIVVRTGDRQLENAVFAVRSVRRIILLAITMLRPERSVIFRIQQSAVLASFIAPRLIAFHLMLQSKNLDKLIDDSLSIMLNALNNLSISDIILTQEPKIMLSDRAEQVWGNLKSDLAELWSDFEWDADSWNTALVNISNPN